MRRDLYAIYSIWLREMLRFFRLKSRLFGSIASPFFFLAFLGMGFGNGASLPGIPSWRRLRQLPYSRNYRHDPALLSHLRRSVRPLGSRVRFPEGDNGLPGEQNCHRPGTDSRRPDHRNPPGDHNNAVGNAPGHDGAEPRRDSCSHWYS